MSDKKKRVFEYDSLQDCESIIRYLKAVTDGFENGTLRLQGNKGEIRLTPQGLIRFEISASQRPDRNRLNLRFTWKPPAEETEEQQGALLIETAPE